MPKDPVDDFEAWEAYKNENKKQEDNFDDSSVWEAYKKSIQKHIYTEDLVEDALPKPKLIKRSVQPPKTKASDTLDLHHMTQDQAYDALKNFLNIAIHNHLRKVLIITGKGKQDQDNPWLSKGILKRMVPRWLQEKPFKEYIDRVEQAPWTKGGTGTLVVYLKKR